MSFWNKVTEPVGQTCPIIDQAIWLYNEATISRAGEEEKKEFNQLMENIREANSKLREWGHEIHDEKKEVEDEVSDLKSKIAELEKELYYAQQEKESLERQLA